MSFTTAMTSIGLAPLAYVFHAAPPSRFISLLDALNAAAVEAEVNTVDRWSMWLAQLGHESMSFFRFEEDLGYSATALLALFPLHFSAADAQAYQHQPERIANRLYCDRLGNGDEASGDGWRYHGRGAIQLTGFANYSAAGTYLGVDLRAQPELAAGPERFRVAAWFWRTHGLNALADQRDVEGCTRRVNGGLIGLAERKAIFDRAQECLSGGGAA